MRRCIVSLSSSVYFWGTGSQVLETGQSLQVAELLRELDLHDS